MPQQARGSDTFLPVSRNEWVLVSLLIVLLLVAVAAPIWHGYQQQPDDRQFFGLVGSYHNDYNSYLAWMHQAVDGRLLFKDLFTSEPHRPVFFHPLFWLMGTASRLAGVPLTVIWYVVHALGCVLMVTAIYRFAAHFTSDLCTRVISILLATTAAGFGWLADVPQDAPWVERPIDLWQAEANQFQAVTTSFFTLPIALGLMLWAFVCFLRYVESGQRRDAVFAGLWALALAAVHQYDMITLYVVLALWTLLVHRRGVERGGRLGGAIVIAAISLPYCLYSLAAVVFNPVFSQLKWSMPSPTAASYVLGWGLPLFLCLAALLPAVWRSNRGIELLWTWLAAGFVILFLPIGIQRKLAWGLHVPICLLAAIALVHWVRAATRSVSAARVRSGILVLASAAVVAFCAIGSLQLYGGLFERNRQRNATDYLSADHMQALEWLGENAEGPDVILSTLYLAPLIPGRTGRAVFFGHWAQTIQHEQKYEFGTYLFSPTSVADADLESILTRNRVRYIVLDNLTGGMAEIPAELPPFSFTSFTKLVFHNDGSAIWELTRYERQSDREPWESGDWRGP